MADTQLTAKKLWQNVCHQPPCVSGLGASTNEKGRQLNRPCSLSEYVRVLPHGYGENACLMHAQSGETSQHYPKGCQFSVRLS